MLQFLSFTLGCESDRSDDIDVIADRRQPILYAATLGRMWVYGGEARRNTGFAAALIFFQGAAGGLPVPRAFGSRGAACSGGPASRNGGFSPLNQRTRHKLRDLLRLRGTCHVQVYKIPQFNFFSNISFLGLLCRTSNFTHLPEVNMPSPVILFFDQSQPNSIRLKNIYRTSYV